MSSKSTKSTGTLTGVRFVDFPDFWNNGGIIEKVFLKKLVDVSS